MILMGSRFDITVVANSQAQGDAYILMAVNEIKRIENIISSWKPDTETSKINRDAGIKPVKVSTELFNLIKRALAISKLTDGAFDISYAAMDKIWHFDGSMTKMPDPETIKNSVRNVGYQHIILNEAKQTVFLERKGMKIGFGAIGKGYAADKAKQLLQSKGVTAGIINASGDMNTWGRQPDGKEWTVAITNPMDKNKAFGLFSISDRAVVTSGDYEKFVRFNGVRYAHIINPKTGYPATGIISATVFAPKAELADALATSVFVMGKEVGIDRINQIPGVECIIVDEKGQVFTSKNIHINPIKQKK
jgi:thiamine biosynthesis lipoprotein